MWKPGGGLTYRRVRVLLDRLPPESATKTAIRDQLTDEQLAQYAEDHPTDGHGSLSRQDMILFDVIDHLKWVEYGLYASQGGKPNKPSPTPRPGVVDPKKKTEKTPPSAEGLAFLALVRERRGE